MLIILIAILIGFIIFQVFSSIVYEIYLIIAFPIVIFLLIVKRITRCPNCKKPYAMEEVSRIQKDSRSSTMEVPKKFYNSKENRMETYFDIVDAIEVKYEITEQCRYCGYYSRPRVEKENINLDNHTKRY